ncbi:MAG TPA: FKBP-type peptidyl-prolyl cis-trans isomerase [Allosphingosinicella sp.]|nr:FKBP-type peptidyl-prolyl cis-trans isomerase [Allosphingosinicella sp.]HYG28724.1 FKBP-type peptidyl-prolyl cis-trans isomerase [Allosphingosinicella sp.]
MSVTAVPIRPLKKGSVLKLWLGIVVLVALAAAAAWYTAGRLSYETTSSGLQYRVIEAGEGPNVGVNDYALVEYVGRLENGTEFDSSRGQPVPMQVNAVVPGFSEALQLMNKGARYRIRIPPNLAYGATGAGGVIPPNATLEFDVTLVDFRTLTPEQRQQLEMMQMMQQGGGGAPPGSGGAGTPPGSEGSTPPGGGAGETPPQGNSAR